MSLVKIEIKEEIEEQDNENRIEMFLVDQEDNLQQNELELNDPLEDTENCVEKKKKNVLSIEERCNILERLDAGEISARLAEEFNVTRAAIFKIKSRRKQILETKNKLENCKGDLGKKRYRGTEEKQFEKDLFAWIELQRSEEQPITGPILQKQAMVFYQQHGGQDNFTASSGWLHNFKKRHGIVLDNFRDQCISGVECNERLQEVENIKEKKASLSIQERCSILERLEAGEQPFKLAKEFNVSKAAISQIKTRKEYILEAKKVLENCKGDINKKRYLGTEDKQFEKDLYAWVGKQRSEGLPITGPILQKQAMIINQELGGKDNFTASDGWLHKFKKRHGIIVDNFREKVSADPIESEAESNDLLQNGEDSAENKEEKKRILSIEERCNILKRLEAGESSIKLAKEFEVSTSAIYKIKSRKKHILSAKKVLENCKGNINKKRYRGTEDKQFEKDLYAWVEQRRSEGLPLSGPILQKQVMIFYKQHGGKDNFTATSGWLHNFKKRHGISLEDFNEEKKISLSIEERCNILERLEAGEMAVTLAKEFNVSKAAIFKIKNRMKYILEAKDKLEDCGKKKYLGIEDKRFEIDLKAWVEQRRSEEQPITGPILQKQAMVFYKQYGGEDNFTASDWWLKNFKKQHGITLDPTEESNERLQDVENIKEKKASLSIEERCSILERLEAGELPVKLAKEFNVSKSAISQIKTRKEYIKEAKKVLENCKGNIGRKRYRGTEDKQFEKELYEWTEQRRSEGLPITGPILKKQAMVLSRQHGGKDNFMASDGWLQKFKKRHGITIDIFREKIKEDQTASEAECNERLQGAENKEERKVILSIEERCNILERLEAGESSVKLAKEFEVSTSAIYKIKSRKNHILSAKKVLENCKGNINKKRYRGTEDIQFEKDLYTWSEQRRSEGLPINGPILQKQAMILYKQHGGDDTFTASSGWLHNFKKRHGIKFTSVQEDTVSSDPEEFKEKLANIMALTGIPPDQIYSCDETGLFWKIMPNGTEGMKKPKNRVTVIMCTNASGTHKLKLFIIGKSKNPSCFRSVTNLPVVFGYQESARMDHNLMMAWFNTVFIPEVKIKHDLDSNPDRRILLIMDSAPCHPSQAEFDAACSFCTTVFLPENAAPLDQRIVEKFKKCYRNRLLTGILAEDDSENYLKSLNLLDCANFCALAWNEVTTMDIKNCWKKLIPFENTSTIDESVDVSSIHSLITRLPRLGEMTPQDTVNWLRIDDMGWNETVLFDGNIVVEEMDDEVVEEEVRNVSSTEALQAMKTYIRWYQRHGDGDPAKLLMLQELEDFAAIKILEERNQR